MSLQDQFYKINLFQIYFYKLYKKNKNILNSTAQSLIITLKRILSQLACIWMSINYVVYANSYKYKNNLKYLFYEFNYIVENNIPENIIIENVTLIKDI